MASVQNILEDKTFQISMTAAIVFLIVAFPPLFSMVDKLLATILGTKIGKNYYTVLVIHAVVVGLLMFLFTSYILKPVYKMLTSNKVEKKGKNLEKFSVGGSLTCGGASN
jgi:hypothetical protein